MLTTTFHEIPKIQFVNANEMFCMVINLLVKAKSVGSFLSRVQTFTYTTVYELSDQPSCTQNMFDLPGADQHSQKCAD